MTRAHSGDLLVGEWACLGILCSAPRHGFAVAARLRPDTDIGRVWSMSRALTYRSLEQLVARGLVEVAGHEAGVAGGQRTILSATRRGRSVFRTWVRTPVEHIRDLRSELLLKILLSAENSIDVTEMLTEQRRRVIEIVETLEHAPGDDVVHLWRREAAQAALRFLERCSVRAAPN